MSTWSSLVTIVLLITIALVGVQVAGMQMVFGVVVPYLAILLFLTGIVVRVVRWAMSPVPFRIPTTSGQARSLPWIRNNSLESPHSALGVVGRMLLEVLLFRSLFRNTKTDLKEGRLLFGSNKWLWLGGLVFHYSFLIIFLRHFKYFAEPTPGFVAALQSVDGFFQIGLPVLFITDITFLVAVSWLFVRRLWIPQIRYISLASDYFPLFLLLAIGTTGVLMRYFIKVDLVAVKELGTGLLSFHPVVPDVGVLFYIHFFLVCCLIAYFPFSKLVHMAGVFLSPTRNLANNNRAKRHVNPWDYPVHVHTYAEYEDEFRPVMKAAGLPLEKEE